MGNICFSFVEIPVQDMKRAIDFYDNVMNIQLEAVSYAGALMAFFPRKEGTPGCALIQDNSYYPSAEGLLVYLDAWEEIESILEKVIKNHGKITLDKTMISENHYYAKFLDCEGNQLALFSTH